MSCICIAIFVVYLLCRPPPSSPVDPAAAVDYTDAEYDYFVDDRTATVKLPGKQSHSLPQISPIFPYISCTRHCYCCCYDYNPIQLHSMFLSALDVPSFNPMLPIITYALFSSKPCTLLARFRIEGRDHSGSDRGNDILQLQQVRINADALGNLQRRDSAESLRVLLTSGMDSYFTL